MGKICNGVMGIHAEIEQLILLEKLATKLAAECRNPEDERTAELWAFLESMTERTKLIFVSVEGVMADIDDMKGREQ